jgi:Necrosis inducing protein (NPP1)
MKRRALSFTLRAVLGAVALTVFVPGVAMAEPPTALPANHAEADGRWQPAFDYDGDGCYPTPAIGPDGTLNPGLNPSGALNGNCHDQSDLDNTNAYSRSKCNNGWCAYLYDLYFEKDQATAPVDCCGHRHDLEHVVIWVNQAANNAEYVSVSCHGDYSTYPRSSVAWDGTHAKIVYHKDGLSTHCFRLASSGEAPENHYGAWQYPDLVSWDGFPPGLRDRLMGADFGSASFAIKDSAFAGNLAEAKPSGIPFDPNA